jgi:hypothetical protein
MKKIFAILALATLAFVGCSKGGGETTDNQKLVFTNSQWIVKEATDLLEPQETYAASCILDFDLATPAKVTTAIVITESTNPEFPVGKFQVLTAVDYTALADEKGNHYYLTFGELTYDIEWVSKDVVVLNVRDRVNEKLTLYRVQKPFTLKSTFTMSNAQWTPSAKEFPEIVIYDFDLYKKGYNTIGVKQKDQDKFYVEQWAAYSESMHDDGTLRVTFQTIEGEAIWKVKKVDDNTCLVYFPEMSGEFEEESWVFKRVEQPFTLYPRD